MHGANGRRSETSTDATVRSTAGDDGGNGGTGRRCGNREALSNPAIPQLSFDHVISSHPFSGTSANASDIEGLGYVASDTSMWVADDNADSVWEINSSTGAYKLRLRAADFEAATQVGTGLTCSEALDAGVVGDTGAFECLSRTDDFESVIYDPTADVLYVTSGGCCTSCPKPLPPGYPNHPTVWKLTRQSGHFAPSQWQALPETEDPTAAGWRSGTGMYFGKGTKIKTYDFANERAQQQQDAGGLEHRRPHVPRRQHRVRHDGHDEHGQRPDHRGLGLHDPSLRHLRLDVDREHGMEVPAEEHRRPRWIRGRRRHDRRP